MNKVQCIVVGAGPAGSACAFTLARLGIETVIIERGLRAGDKNVASFVLIPDVLERMIPDYRESAPLERPVTDFTVLQLLNNGFYRFQTGTDTHRKNPPGYTAFRGRFDAWFAGKAEEAGAQLVTGMTVSDVIFDGRRAVGIRVGGDELYADVIVGADGVNSIVAEKAGLAEKLDVMGTHLAVKEVLDMEPGRIEERFQLGPGEGTCIHGLSCYPVDDVGGFFSLYTNRDSVSLSCFGTIGLLADKGVRLPERIELLKAHPHIQSLIKGSNTREYQAHLLSYGGRVRMKNVYADGVLLCGEAGGFLNSFKIGVPTGMLTGMLAARTIERAVRKKDFSRKCLKGYRELLGATPLPRLVKKGERYNRFYVKRGMKNIPVYNEAVLSIGEGIVQEQFDFINNERYPFVKVAYHKMIKISLPAPARIPLQIIVGAVSLIVRLLKKLKPGRKTFERK